MKKISQVKKYCSPIKRVCFHAYKIFSHIKNDLVRYTKNSWQIATPNSHGKFLFQIPTANSCGKFPRNIATAIFRGKFPRQILKFAIQKMVWSNPLGGRISPMSIKREHITNQNLIKVYNTIASELVQIRELISKQRFQTFQKLVLVENDWHVLYLLHLLYQLSSYHPYIQKRSLIWI